MLNHTGGTFSHSGMMDCPRFPFLELHLAKFLDSMEFESWKLNFRTGFVEEQANPQITMHWIKEIEILKSIDELMTSRSIMGRTDFPDFDVQIHFLQRVCDAQFCLTKTHSTLTSRSSHFPSRYQEWSASDCQRRRVRMCLTGCHLPCIIPKETAQRQIILHHDVAAHQQPLRQERWYRKEIDAYNPYCNIARTRGNGCG